MTDAIAQRDSIEPTQGKLVRPLTDAVAEAGALAHKMFREGCRNWLKGNSSPVSEADIAVDRLLRERLAALDPEAGWLSEETERDPEEGTRERYWIVDPVDGTRAFIKGLPDWVVSAAFVEGGRPSVAVLFAPVTDECFVALAGAGATRNGKPIRAGGAQSLTGARVAGSKSRLRRLAESGFPIVVEPYIHSLALRLARVASGEIDASISGPKSRDWDLAAADLLVHEAGGKLTTLEGLTPLYHRPETEHPALVAAGRGLHPILLKALAETVSASAG